MGWVDVTVFALLAGTILIGALKMLNAKETMHAVVWLALTLTGVAGIFLSLGAEFVAAIQLLVYVGAVVTLILFTVMVTTPAKPTEGFAEDRTHLSVLGIPAPPGWDVEHVEELDDTSDGTSEGTSDGTSDDTSDDGDDDDAVAAMAAGAAVAVAADADRGDEEE